jgi:hypothetical protein
LLPAFLCSQELPLLDGGYYGALEGQLYDLSNFAGKDNYQVSWRRCCCCCCCCGGGNGG